MTKTTHALLRATGVLLAASTALAGTSLVAQTAQVAPAAPAKAKLGMWGVDLTSRDTSVKPGDDFQKYASGSWIAKTQIPADKPEVGSFYEVYDLSQDQLKAVVTSAPVTSQYGALYQSMMDEARVETVGIAPLKEDRTSRRWLATWA
jgi:putative endopeptidase